jgi:hypothetical protein
MTDLPLGTRLCLTIRGRSLIGTVRYVGMVGSSGLCAGIELDEPLGKNDGSFGSTRYFHCRPLYGIFSPLSAVKALKRAPPQSMPISHSVETMIPSSDASELEKLRIALTRLQSHIAKQPGSFAAELEQLAAIHERQILELRIEFETQITNLESDIFEATVRPLPTTPSETPELTLLRQIEAEHKEIVKELNQTLLSQQEQAKAIAQANGRLVVQARRLLKEKKECSEDSKAMKARIEELVRELSSDNPEWKNIAELRRQHRGLARQSAALNEQLRFQTAEAEAMDRFWGLFSDIPFLDSLRVLLRLKAKTRKLEVSTVQKMEIGHYCDLIEFVLAGRTSSFSKSAELFNAVSGIENMIDDKTCPSFDGFVPILQSVTPCQLDLALTPHFLKAVGERSDGHIRRQLLAMAEKVREVMHPDVLRKEKEAFVGFVTGLKAELAKGSAASLEPFVEIVDVFIGDRIPEDDVVGAFFRKGRRDRRHEVIRRVSSGRLVRDSLAGELEMLQAELEKERATFGALRGELADSLAFFRDYQQKLEDARLAHHDE